MNNNKAKVSIRKGKYNLISVQYDADWTVLYVNGHSYYEGEEVPDTIWLELLELMAGAEIEIAFGDETVDD